MTALTFAILSLAAYRAARAVSLDSITEGFRQSIDDRAGRSSSWAYLSQLVGCGFCTSFWLAGVTVFVYLSVTGTADDQSFLVNNIYWWAVAGAANLLIAFDSFLLREAPPHD